MKDYTKDKYGKACLEEAEKCKVKLGFGAILVKDEKIIGRGRNRLSTLVERKLIPNVDYAIHAEQAAIYDALSKKYDLEGSEVYVLGKVLRGKEKGKLTTRNGDRRRVPFICMKCPTVLKKYNISVNVPHVNGWTKLSPETAERRARKICGNGYWKKFSGGK